MRRTVQLALVVVVLSLAAPAAGERLAGSEHGGMRLTATLSGAEEVPDPGDPDGTGTAVITINRGQEEVCSELTVDGIDPATAAHIHAAASGSAGPVVVTLPTPSSGSSQGCSEVDRETVDAIAKNPGDYYVNVHNAAFPAGAVRGQLGR